MVQLFHNSISNPQIVELQKMILQDLTGSKNIPEIRKHEDGQREMGRLLKKVSALIYIDNVLDEHTLRQMNARKTIIVPGLPEKPWFELMIEMV